MIRIEAPFIKQVKSRFMLLATVVATLGVVSIPALASAAPSKPVYCRIQNVPKKIVVNNQGVLPFVNVVNNSTSEITTDVSVTESLINSSGSKGGEAVSHIVLPAGYNFDYPTGTLYPQVGDAVKIVAKSTSGPKFRCSFTATAVN